MGDVILVRPFIFYVLTYIIVALSIGLIFLLFFGKYADKAVVKGQLLPDAGIVKVVSPRQGIISSLSVDDGDIVKKGQVLLNIDSEDSLEKGREVSALVLQEVSESIKKLNKDRENIKKESELKRASLLNRLSATKKVLSNLTTRIKTQENAVASSKDRLDRERELMEKGVVSRDKYQRSYEASINQQAALEDLFGQKITRESELQQIESELTSLPIHLESNLNKIEGELSALRQKKLQTESAKRLVITSPINGKVSSLQARNGMFTRGQHTLLSILPEDSELYAEVYVVTSAIGFVKKGQRVRMKYNAFPYQQYGVYEGEIVDIARNALMPAEVAESSVIPPVFNIQEPVYIIKVKLDSQSVKAFGKSFPLQPGMLLDADILLRERTLIQKIFLDPIYKFKGSF